MTKAIEMFSRYNLSQSISYHESFQITAERASFQAMTETPQTALWQRTSSPTPRRLGDTTFQYVDLDPTRSEIRLLRILPETTTMIKCEVLHTSLDSPRSYIAISYTWGDSEDTRMTMLDGHEFPVTESLFLILQRLRSRSFPVIVWADAVCINQRNIAERNHQVQMMTSIYCKAYTVAIWLGPEADNSELAMILLCDIAEANPAQICEIIKSPSRRAHFAALAALYERGYWDRLWVVQEVANASDITVYCGPGALPWKTYLTASNLLVKHNPDLIRAFISIRNSVTVHESSADSRFPWEFTFRSCGPVRLHDVKNPDGSPMGLLDALLGHRDKTCSDPRDKVYGLLGILSPHERSQFLVDYNISTREVFTNVVDYLLTTTRRLDVICASFHLPLHKSMERLPSWVPDWSHDPDVSPLGWRRRFSAAGNTAAEFHFSGRRSRLEIAAIFIDTVDARGTHIRPPYELNDILMAFFEWRLQLIASKGYDIAWHEAFCRTLCLDQANDRWTPREWMEWIYHVFATLLRERYPVLEPDPQLIFYAKNSPLLSTGLREQTFIDYIEGAVLGRAFAITSSGLLCLGSGGVTVDDIICVPLGCSTPVILRKKNRGYIYISDVYVDGYMYGRAIEELNNAVRQLETFVIY